MFGTLFSEMLGQSLLPRSLYMYGNEQIEPLCAKSSCTYQPPKDYEATLFPRRFSDDFPKPSKEIITEIFQNCLTLFSADVFYVENEQLKGCLWLNIPSRMRILLLNYWSGGENNRQAIAKIEETLQFILRIRAPLVAKHKEGLDVLRTTAFSFERGGSGVAEWYADYTDLANKILARYPEEKKLGKLIERISHERPYWIKGNGITVRNIKKHAKGTPWESTTAWEEA